MLMSPPEWSMPHSTRKGRLLIVIVVPLEEGHVTDVGEEEVVLEIVVVIGTGVEVDEEAFVKEEDVVGMAAGVEEEDVFGTGVEEVVDEVVALVEELEVVETATLELLAEVELVVVIRTALDVVAAEAHGSLPVRASLLYNALGAPLTMLSVILPPEVEVKSSQVSRSVKATPAGTPLTVTEP